MSQTNENIAVRFTGISPVDNGYTVHFLFHAWVPMVSFNDTDSGEPEPVGVSISVGRLEVDEENPLDSAKKVAIAKLHTLFESFRQATQEM